MIESKTIILCADDFGLNASVSRGILKLVEHNRLSSVSCIVNCPDFYVHAPQLLALKKQVQIGMHFNLTEGYLLSNPATSCFTLKELLIKTHLHLIKHSLIVKEFNAQLELYVRIMGALPDFIDGHQHIHQFPKIRQVVLDLYTKHLKKEGAFIRSTYPTLTLHDYKFKAKILALTGGKALSEQLKKLEIPHNTYFSGVYDFAAQTDYRSLFRQWLAQAQNNTLIMCHPGERTININETKLENNYSAYTHLGEDVGKCSNTDPIALARSKERSYFLSDEFLNDCHEHQIVLAR